MTTLDITALRSLTAVSSFAGVQRAAESLHLSQSTVSGHLRRLEHELDVVLVQRVGRNITLTSAGEELVRRAHRIIGLHDDAVDAVRGSMNEDLVIASSDLAAAPLLRIAVGILESRFPGRRITFRFRRSERLREFAVGHGADIVLGFTDLGSGARHVADLPLTWVRTDSDAAVLETNVAAFTRPCGLREAIERSLRDSDATVSRECLDLTAVLGAVRAGEAITALPVMNSRETGLRAITGPAPLPDIALRAVVAPRVGAHAGDELLAALRAHIATASLATA